MYTKTAVGKFPTHIDTHIQKEYTKDNIKLQLDTWIYIYKSTSLPIVQKN